MDYETQRKENALKANILHPISIKNSFSEQKKIKKLGEFLVV